MRRGYVVPMMWVVIQEDVVPGGHLNLNSTNLPRPRSPRESSPLGKIPTVESGIEPGTSWLVGRESDHQTTRLVDIYIYIITAYSHIYIYTYICECMRTCIYIFFDFVVFPPGHGRRVTDFWVWDAREVRLRCPDEVSGDIGGCSARRALKPKFN